MKHLSGFGNHFSSEALDGALPDGQNTPQKCPFGLYAELISGTAFTAPRTTNSSSWLYRIRPSVCHDPFESLPHDTCMGPAGTITNMSPNQLRWNAMEEPKQPITFIEGLTTICATGDINQRTGSAIHLYACNEDMTQTFFYNNDGEFLIVPQDGGLIIKTEFGPLTVEPLEIALIPRGIKFSIELTNKAARGYVCENFGAPFTLPDLGPIGSHGLANKRDFMAPQAQFCDESG